MAFYKMKLHPVLFVICTTGIILSSCSRENSKTESAKNEKIEGNTKSDDKMSFDEVKRVIEELEMSINNGGFDQYFSNSYGNDTHAAIVALQLIKANSMASILEEAVSRFPKNRVPVDRTKRQEQLEKISPDSELFYDLDKQFLDYPDDIEVLLKRFSV